MQIRQRDTLDRAKLVLIVVCLIAIPVTFWVNHSDVGHVNSRVTKVESPCLRYGAKSNQCKAAFEQAVLTITHPEACAVERKAGTLRAIRELAVELQVSFTEPCAGARLAQERKRGNERAATKRSAGGGDASQPGSTGHQQPSPPSHGGHVGGGHEGQNEAPPQNPSVTNPPTTPSSPAAPATSPSQPSFETPSGQTPPASGSANPPGLLTPTTEHLPEPVKPVVEGVCSAVSRAVHLC